MSKATFSQQAGRAIRFDVEALTSALLQHEPLKYSPYSTEVSLTAEQAKKTVEYFEQVIEHYQPDAKFRLFYVVKNNDESRTVILFTGVTSLPISCLSRNTEDVFLITGATLLLFEFPYESLLRPIINTTE